jgi:Fe2+ or Zn2+ uptake regulation protein
MQELRAQPKELIATGDHPDASLIFKRVRRKYPTTSLGTVYKVLALFADIGLVNEFRSVEGGVRFCANPLKHHHLVRSVCHKITDIVDSELDRIPLARIETAIISKLWSRASMSWAENFLMI